MLWTLIKQTEWRPFLDLLSPSFFRVVPAGPLVAELRRLASLYRSKADFERAIAHRSVSLGGAGLPIRITTGDASLASTEPMNPGVRGQLILDARTMRG